jgi:hypothetical protein
MGLSKDYIQQALAQLEADIAQVPAPKDLEVLVPAFVVYGFPPVPNPLTPENGKVYIFEYLTEDLTILLPTGVEPGFCFEVWGIECNNVGPYRLEVVAPPARIVVVGDCILGPNPPYSTQKFVLDGDGDSHEAVRFTYLGLVDFTAAGQSIIGIWKMERLDDKSNVTKMIHYATAAALPAHTATGEGPDRVLTADGSGNLTIDGRTYTEIVREKILVKDEVDQDSNGIYWLTQVNPWVLRRASIDQNEFQVNRRGALIQVMFGTANGGKQFYRGGYTGNIAQVAGGGGGYATIQNEGSGLPQQTMVDFQGAGVTASDGGSKTVVTIPGGGALEQVYTSNISSPVTAVVGKYYLCRFFSGSPSHLQFNLPTPASGILGKEIGFKRWQDWGDYGINFGTTNIDEKAQILRHPDESMIIRCVEVASTASYKWTVVSRNRRSMADYARDASLQTLNAAQTPIASISVASNKALYARIVVWARQTSGTGGSGNAGKWVIEALIERDGIAAPTIKSQQYAVPVFKDISAWDVVLSITGGDTFSVSVQGAASSTIEWRCQLEVSEHG